MLEKLKGFEAERCGAEELVALSAFGRSLAEEYTRLKLDAPDWLNDRIAEVGRELQARLADMKAKRVKELKAKLSTLRTAEERRKDIEAELARLEA
jgi:hypothetical protein